MTDASPIVAMQVLDQAVQLAFASGASDDDVHWVFSSAISKKRARDPSRKWSVRVKDTPREQARLKKTIQDLLKEDEPAAELQRWAVFRQDHFVTICPARSATEAVDNWINASFSVRASRRALPGPWSAVPEDEARHRGMIR